MKLLEREPLLDTLHEFHAASIGGAGCMVFVSGEAGIGKSALAHGFCDDLPDDSAVYYGFCDAFQAPRALGPLHDIARSGLDGLSTLLASEHDRHTLFSEFLDLFGAKPSVTVIEDVQWADEATLDLLIFLGRRIADLPCMVVVTVRSEEVGSAHPLRRVLGDLATARAVRRLSVPSLSEAAVAQLAESAGIDVTELYAATSGNPFFVTEVLGAPGEHVPSTVRDVVLARAARLSDGARTVLDVLSMLQIRADIAMVRSLVTPGAESSATAAMDEAVESGMLVRDGDAVWIRHGLACRAIEVAVPAERAVDLHRGIVAFLAESSTADPARLSFHADAARDSAATLRYAPTAGALATRLGAHREAAEQYRRALRHATEAPAAQLAPLWESLSDALERSHWTSLSRPGENQLSDALDASEHAVKLWRAVGDDEREVVVMARRSHMLWNAGRCTEAQETARATVALLELMSPGPTAAQAYSALARLHMLAHDDAAARSLGTIAVTNAEHHGDGATLAEALGVVASTHWMTDPTRAVELMTAALRAAREAGDDLAVAAILCGLGSRAAESRRYQLAERWLAEAVA